MGLGGVGQKSPRVDISSCGVACEFSFPGDHLERDTPEMREGFFFKRQNLSGSTQRLHYWQPRIRSLSLGSSVRLGRLMVQSGTLTNTMASTCRAV